MNFSKDYSKIILIFLFGYFLLLNIFQLSHQHWTAILDQDLHYIYNSLLISSGIEQEYKDHPAYTTFLILGSIYKFFSIFFDNFTIQEVAKSKNIDEILQTLFIIARVLNSIYFFLVALIMFNILKELNIKKNLCIFGILLLIFFGSTYELLFRLRSEILSVLMFLLFLYFLIKFIKRKNKITYCFISGFFFCLAMLAKIQIIFLFITFLISLPFLFNYFTASENKRYLIQNKRYYFFSLFFLCTLFVGYITTQIILATYITKFTDEPRFHFPQNIDFFLLSIFIIFYFFLIKLLSAKKKINFTEIISTISTIFLGYISCLIFIFFLDLINLVPLNKLILLKLVNPILYMTSFNHEILLELDKNIFLSLKDYFIGSLGFYSVNFNSVHIIPKILLIDNRIFFRSINLIIFVFLIYFLAKKIKNNNLVSFSIVLFFGIIIYYLSFNFRETHGYNIFIFPLYIILALLILNKIEKKFVLIFCSLLSISFLSEIISLSGLHKNHFSRESRIYGLCKIEKWKNSKNYFSNIKKTSFVNIYRDENAEKYFNLIFKFDDQFLIKYCDQMKNHK